MKTKILFLSIICCGLFTFAQNSEAATLYVSPTGSDSNAGTSAAPFKTIQKAANIVNPGDTVLVRAGIYGNFKITRGGSIGFPIIFKNYNGENVTINSYSNSYANTQRAIEILGDVGYIEINGLKLTDPNPLYDSAAYADYSQGANRELIKLSENGTFGPHHVTITNCTLYDGGFAGIFTSKYSHDITITNNTFYDLGLSKRGYGLYVAGGNNHSITGNTMYRTGGMGIQIVDNAGTGMSGVVIEKNKIYDTGMTDYCKGYLAQAPDCPYYTTCNPVGGICTGLLVGDGITIFDTLVSSPVVRNNIVYDNLRFGIRVMSTRGTVVYNTVYHNTLSSTQSADAGIYVYAGDGVTVANNISYANSKQQINTNTGNTSSNNLTTTDPLFINASAGNFALQSNSPAINAGTALDAPSTDVQGIKRPQGAGFDIGAYEYVGSDTNPPANPTGLRVQ